MVRCGLDMHVKINFHSDNFFPKYLVLIDYDFKIILVSVIFF